MRKFKMSKKAINQFWSKVKKTDYCWNWIGAEAHGYGVFSHTTPQSLRAHRVSFYLSGTNLNKKLVIDHLCNNKKCVNPQHLEQVTQKLNVQRGLRKQMKYLEFSLLIDKLIKKGNKQISICKDFEIYPQKLNYYLKAAKKTPDKMVPVELNEKLKSLLLYKKKDK